MKLRYSAASPYVRKILVVAHEHGLDGKIERIPTQVWTPDSDIAKDNPLGKVPALIADDGAPLFDSPVICEYLDNLGSGAKLFPAAGPARWKALTLQALGDGVLDAAILRRLEGNRPDGEKSKSWMDRQATAMKRGMDAFDAAAGGWGSTVTIGQIAAGCTCGYLDFRYAHEDWRPNRPTLAAWYAAFAKRPSMQKTIPQG